jgi:hypothetical protein
MALYRDFADLIALKQKARSRIAWALLRETSSWEASLISFSDLNLQAQSWLARINSTSTAQPTKYLQSGLPKKDFAIMIKFPPIIISEPREGRYREIPMYPILATAIQFLIDL